MENEIQIVETLQIEGYTDEPTGRVYDVTLIEGGMNKAKTRFYTSEALDSMVSLANTNGLQCMADHLSASQSRDKPEGSILNVVGWFDKVRREGNKVVGNLNMLTEGAPFPHLPIAMKEAFDRGNKDLFQLSIRGSAPPKRGTIEGVKTDIIGPLTRLMSTDLVTRGGAGGQVVNLIASERDELKQGVIMDKIDVKEMLRDISTEDMAEALKETHPSLVDREEVKETQEENKEEVETKEVVVEDTLEKTVDPVVEASKIYDDIKRERFIMQAERFLNGSDLPAIMKSQIQGRIDSKVYDTMEELTVAIDYDKKVYDEVVKETRSQSPTLAPMRDFSVEEGGTFKNMDADSIYKGLVGLIGRKSTYQDVRAFVNIKEAFYNYKMMKNEPVDMFSGAQVAYAIVSEANHPFDPMLLDSSGAINEAMAEDSFVIQESIISTTFSTLLGAAMHKVFLDSYRDLAAEYGDYQKIISRTNIVTDFKAHNHTRRGIYSSLPSVAEGGTYQPLTSPGEENVALTVVKYGGTEDYTLEAIANDDLNALQSIPRDLALAAIVGRYDAVFDLFTANSGDGAQMDYDTTNLFDTSAHSNRGTTALSSDALIVGMNLMRAQTALSASGVNLFIKPKYILVPDALDRISSQMFLQDFEVGALPIAGGRNNMSMNPVKGKVEPIVIPSWSSAVDWRLVADPSRWDTIALALLQGHEEPQIVFQNDPSVGSVFTADKITIKARDIRDQDLLDHRSFFGANV